MISTTNATRMMRWRLPSGHDVESVEVSQAIAQRVDDVLECWRDTPYASGQQALGVGVDCVRFGAAVLDQLDGRVRVPPERLPQDIALHNRGEAMKAMRTFLRGYTPNNRVLDGFVEPGDIVVTGFSGGGPGHLQIIGGRSNTIWHATGSRVQMTGFGFRGNGQQRIVGIFRFAERWRWIESARPLEARDGR